MHPYTGRAKSQIYDDILQGGGDLEGVSCQFSSFSVCFQGDDYKKEKSAPQRKSCDGSAYGCSDETECSFCLFNILIVYSCAGPVYRNRIRSTLVSKGYDWLTAARYCHWKYAGSLLTLQGAAHQKVIGDYLVRRKG